MIATRTILCPFDGSGFSMRAVQHATALGPWYKANIMLLYVHGGGRSSNFEGHEFRLAYAFRPSWNVMLRVHDVEGIELESPDGDRAGRREAGASRLQYRLLNARCRAPC